MIRPFQSQEQPLHLRLFSMWKWPLNMLFKTREDIALDRGCVDAHQPFETHLDDFLTMLLRMAVTLSAAFIFAFFSINNQLVGEFLMCPIHLAGLDDKVQLVGITGCGDFAGDPLIPSHWKAAAIILSVPVLAWIRLLQRKAELPNFK
ncbi:MAG: Sec-independent protein translocase protein TatC [Verrucomicrobiaceae bacterium]|nr:Sec-independent protein translocase protein TatC [Verrucomicrobiaceae bacterium]